MNLYSQNETLTVVAPIQPYAYTNFHQSVLDALTWRRKFLDTALTALMLRTAALAEVAALLVEAIRSGCAPGLRFWSAGGCVHSFQYQRRVRESAARGAGGA